MPITRTKAQQFDTRPSFDWVVIPCANREAAQAEAERQQAADAMDVVWIYLQRDDGRWVARRTPLDLEAFQPAPEVFGIRPERDPLWIRVAVKLVELIFGQ